MMAQKINLRNLANNVKACLSQVVLPDPFLPRVDYALVDTGISVQGMIPGRDGGTDQFLEERVSRGVLVGVKIVDVACNLHTPIILESHIGW